MARATAKDYYRVLNVPETAGADEIKKAYRKLAKRYHPDANPDDVGAADRFKEVGEAYAVLSDPEKRRQYDEMRRYGAFSAHRRQQTGTGARGSAEGVGFSFEDLGDIGFGGGMGSDLGDLFSSIFETGKRRRTGTGGQPRRGSDVEYVAEIPFFLAVRGGKLPITVPVAGECGECGGTGGAPGSQLGQCGECGGRGAVSFGQGGFAVQRPCPACLGRGVVPAQPCGSCGGAGEVRKDRQVLLTVPAGVDNGSRLRLAGQGAPGGAGQRHGDLIVSFRVKPHRFFRREGLDIHCTVPINIAQAVMGSKIRVKTVHGDRVTLKIPAGTQNGTRFRVRGRGVEKSGRRGDQYVQINVQVPEEVSDEARRQMREFARAADLRY